jgi:membrane-associated phospholipid phosphatase
MWLLSLCACAVLTGLSFGHLDVALARYFWGTGKFLHPLNRGFSATVALSLESAVALGLILTRLIRGYLSRLGETLVIACLTSICTYAFNDSVLKPCFGVPVPTDVLQGAVHRFNVLAGAGNYGFPSGHMVLAASFAGVLMSLYRVSIWPLSALLVLAAALLVIGDWHFLSDVIAGSFVGLSAGLLAGSLWSLHAKQPR